MFEFEDVKKGKLSEEEFDKLISASESSQNNFLILTSEIVPILKGKYAPVYNEICKYNDKISITTDFKTLKSIKDELAYRYDIPNRAYIFEQIVQRLRVLQSNEYTFTLTDESIKSVDSIRNLVLKVQPNFPKRVTMFKKIPLMDFNNDECELAIKCISQGKWEFYFKGEETNIIYKILSDING